MSLFLYIFISFVPMFHVKHFKSSYLCKITLFLKFGRSETLTMNKVSNISFIFYLYSPLFYIYIENLGKRKVYRVDDFIIFDIFLLNVDFCR